MTSYTPVLLLLGAMVPLLAGTAGIVLFIVGLVKKKPAMWGSGLALAVVSFLIVAVGLGALFFVGVRGAQTASRRAVARAPQVAVAEIARQPQTVFATCTGLELPADIMVVADGGRYSRSGQTNHYMKLLTSDAFGTFLAEHFAEATWADVRDAMATDEARSFAFWDLAGGESMRCYRRTYRSPTAAPGSIVTYVAHDPNTHTAYVVSVQQ
ncbi:MAG TPA: hypothetical protein VM031_05220 [Phycisphaerae bacterium]|nr:hypothetical protein [Phycisphaerae bacterium]